MCDFGELQTKTIKNKNLTIDVPAILDVMRYRCINFVSSLPQRNLTSVGSSDGKKYRRSFTFIQIVLCSEYITCTLADEGVK